MFNTSYYKQIGTAARCGAKRAMATEGHMGRVLRRTCEAGGLTPFLIDIMWSPVAGRNALKCSKTYRWGKAVSHAPRGPACDYIPVLWLQR